jgi:4-hydroxy-3-polyprenylbenzoate decarboxylase
MGLRKFIDILERQGELIRIKGFVDPVLEIAEVTDRFSKQPGGGKALLFENTGTAFPVLTNMMGSERRICSALGISSLDESVTVMEQFFRHLTAPKKNLRDKVRFLSELRHFASWMPKSAGGRGPCQDVVHVDPDLDIFPVLKCWPADGGRFITLPVVHTRDPHTGIRNAGMYRMQVLDARHTGMHWHRHKTGARHYSAYRQANRIMPVAVTLGGDPVYAYSAIAPLPDNVDEYILAGFLRRSKVRMVRCITQDMEVPADADIVIEGFVDPSEEPVLEGPFGDHTGFYSLADRYPRFHVTCITHRKDAVYPATVVGIPPQEDVYFSKATEKIFLIPIKTAMLPEIKNIHMPEPGTSHNLALIQIQKTYPGQGHKTIHSLWGAGQMMFNKILVVTDIPVCDYPELIRQVLKRIDLHTDIIIGKGPLDVLDHTSPHFSFGSKAGIDATSKWPEENSRNVMDANSGNYLAPLDKDVLSAGYPAVTDWNLSLLNDNIPVVVLGIHKPDKHLSDKLGKQLLCDRRFGAVKIFILLDDTADIHHLHTVCWLTCANTDPERDILMAGDNRQQMVVDACPKLPGTYGFERNWPNVVASSEETVAAVNAKWEQWNLGNPISSPSLKFIRMKHGDGAVCES